MPRLFDGVLPELSFGTAAGVSCSPDILKLVTGIAYAKSDFSVVENARFKGGYITRNYGKPDENVHTIQLEINQSIYMSDDQVAMLDETKCARIRPLLRQFVSALCGV